MISIHDPRPMLASRISLLAVPASGCTPGLINIVDPAEDSGTTSGPPGSSSADIVTGSASVGGPGGDELDSSSTSGATDTSAEDESSEIGQDDTSEADTDDETEAASGGTADSSSEDDSESGGPDDVEGLSWQRHLDLHTGSSLVTHIAFGHDTGHLVAGNRYGDQDGAWVRMLDRDSGETLWERAWTAVLLDMCSTPGGESHLLLEVTPDLRRAGDYGKSNGRYRVLRQSPMGELEWTIELDPLLPMLSPDEPPVIDCTGGQTVLVAGAANDGQSLLEYDAQGSLRSRLDTITTQTGEPVQIVDLVDAGIGNSVVVAARVNKDSRTQTWFASLDPKGAIEWNHTFETPVAKGTSVYSDGPLSHLLMGHPSQPANFQIVRFDDSAGLEWALPGPEASFAGLPALGTSENGGNFVASAHVGADAQLWQLVENRPPNLLSVMELAGIERVEALLPMKGGSLYLAGQHRAGSAWVGLLKW